MAVILRQIKKYVKQCMNFLINVTEYLTRIKFTTYGKAVIVTTFNLLKAQLYFIGSNEFGSEKTCRFTRDSKTFYAIKRQSMPSTDELEILNILCLHY